MSVQDQSKERGVSGGLELNEDKESSPGIAPNTIVTSMSLKLNCVMDIKCTAAFIVLKKLIFLK